MKDELFNDSAILEWLSRLLRVHFHIKHGEEVKFSFPPEGNRTALAIAECSGSQDFVIKLHHSFWKFLRVCYNTQRLRSLGISVPTLLFWSIQTRFTRTRRYLTIEEFISGNVIENVPEQSRTHALIRIAESLAALHSIKWHRHGWFMSPRRDAYIERYAQRTISRLSRLKEFIGAEEFQYLSNTIIKESRKIGRRPSYELIHGRVNDNNFLVTESSAYMIDLLNVHFGDFARDLVRALHRLCKHNSENENLFLKRYFCKVRNLTQNDYRSLAPFYHCDFHIDEAAGKLRSWKHGQLGEEQFRNAVKRDIHHSIEALFSNNRI